MTTPLNSGSVFEWYQTNQEIDYPFDSRTVDGSYRLFVDAYVVHNKYRTEASRLQLVSFDPAGTLVLTFEDSTPLASLTAADGFNVSTFGDYVLYRWAKSTSLVNGLTDVDLAVQLVVVSAELSNFSFPLSPPQAFLLASLVNPRTSRVRHAALSVDGAPCCFAVTGNQLIFEEGNNIQLTLQATAAPSGLGIVSASTERVPAVITVDAIPGAGAGKVVNCDSTTPPIKLINNTGPNTIGNFALDGVDCTWVERRVASTEPPVHPNTNYLATMYQALLQLHQDCPACCACEDYGNVYNAFLALWERARKAAALIEKVREEYNALVEKIKAIKVITETGLNVKTQAIGRPDYHLAVQVTVWNDSAKDITDPVAIIVALDTIGYVYAPHSGIVDAAGLHKAQIDPIPIGANGFEFTIPGLKSTGYAQVSFEIRYTKNTMNHSSVPVSRVGRIVEVFGNASYGLSVIVSDTVFVPLVGPLVLD